VLQLGKPSRNKQRMRKGRTDRRFRAKQMKLPRRDGPYPSGIDRAVWKMRTCESSRPIAQREGNLSTALTCLALLGNGVL
jgi:hypothetical protein